MEQCRLKLQLLAGAGPQAGGGSGREKLGKQDLVSGIAVSMAHSCPTSQGWYSGLVNCEGHLKSMVPSKLVSCLLLSVVGAVEGIVVFIVLYYF